MIVTALTGVWTEEKLAARDLKDRETGSVDAEKVADDPGVSRRAGGRISRRRFLDGVALAGAGALLAGYGGHRAYAGPGPRGVVAAGAEDGFNHQYVEANGIRVHYVRQGSGTPLVLLHGWPEFWYAWHKNIGPLAESFDVVVPDLRGFGETEKVTLPNPPAKQLDDLVEDLRGLADALGLERIGIVSHDVGSFVAQQFATRYPERVAGLFFDCIYPGIGNRRLEPQNVSEIWYQTFNQFPWAQDLVGESRNTCRIFFKHFLDRWAHAPGRFDEDLDLYVDNFLRQGNLRGGFDWYVAINDARIRLAQAGAPQVPTKLQTPTRFLWGQSDPILKVEWADNLGDYFADYEFAPAPGAGHFVHYERPELANAEIVRFFGSL